MNLYIFTFQHASLGAPSVCTLIHIKQYFVGGTLPKEGTVCEPLRGPFDPIGESFLGLQDSQGVIMDQEIIKMVEVANDLSMNPVIKGFGTL